jgi:capsular polysaccharide transport system ATP-binding protein
MIILDKVIKTVRRAHHRQRVLVETTMIIPTDRRIALLGSSEEDKRILIDILAGLLIVDSGVIIRKARLSFPVGTLPGFDKRLSLRRNVEHFAYLYSANVRDAVELVRQIVDLGRRFETSTLMQLQKEEIKRLRVALPLSLPFDSYLFTADNLGPGHECWELFCARHRSAGMIIPIFNEAFAREYCDAAMVLSDGKLLSFETVDQGLAFMAELQKTTQPEATTARS